MSRVRRAYTLIEIVVCVLPATVVTIVTSVYLPALILTVIIGIGEQGLGRALLGAHRIILFLTIWVAAIVGLSALWELAIHQLWTGRRWTAATRGQLIRLSIGIGGAMLAVGIFSNLPGISRVLVAVCVTALVAACRNLVEFLEGETPRASS